MAVMPVRQSDYVANSNRSSLISLFDMWRPTQVLLPFLCSLVKRSAKENSIVGRKFMDIPNGHGRRLSWSSRVDWCRDRRRLQESFETGGREHEEIVVLSAARITQLVRDVARGNQSITLPKNKHLVSDGDLQFSGENIVDLILTRMRMTRYTHPTARVPPR